MWIPSQFSVDPHLSLGIILLLTVVCPVIWFLIPENHNADGTPQESVAVRKTVRVNEFDWILFLKALEVIEAPKTAAQKKASIDREGAYGMLQIRQPCLDDVNARYGTSVTLEQVQHNRGISRWVCVHYLRMYNADTGYERAARTWNGGPRGPFKQATEPYWHRVKSELTRIQAQETQ